MTAPPFEDGTATVEISEGCSEILGAALGLDWVAFGSRPTTFETPEDTAQLLVAALWFLLATDLGPTDEACALLPAESAACEEFRDTAFESDGIGRALFEFVESNTRLTRPLPHQVEAYASSLDQFVYWSDPLSDALGAEGPEHTSVGVVAAVMVHEAGHAVLARHKDDCSTTAALCDADGAQTFGLNAMVLELRRSRVSSSDGVSCRQERLHLLETCTRWIEDVDGLAACHALSEPSGCD